MPKLTREVSTFVYGAEPEFFSDEFFLKYADTVAMRGLLDPDRMKAVRDRPASTAYLTALRVAQSNLGFLADRDVTIAFGTDTGPAGRFQGYFEHMEMDLMSEAGLTPDRVRRRSPLRARFRCIRS